MNSSIGNYSIINNDNSVKTEKSEKTENDVIMSDINILNQQMQTMNLSSPVSGGAGIGPTGAATMPGMTHNQQFLFAQQPMFGQYKNSANT